MPVEARDDFARITPDGTSQQHSIEIPRRLRIELVNAISQERAELFAFLVISTPRDLRIHGVQCSDSTAALMTIQMPALSGHALDV